MRKLNDPLALQSVCEFHKHFDIPVLNRPQIPDKSRCELRVELLREELEELIDAIDNSNVVDIADALADLQYILSGTILEFGMGKIFKELFDEVHRSNMSKICDTEEIAYRTIEHYEEKGQLCRHYKRDGKYIVKRDDGKLMKSIEYNPTELSSIIYGV